MVTEPTSAYDGVKLAELRADARRRHLDRYGHDIAKMKRADVVELLEQDDRDEARAGTARRMIVDAITLGADLDDALAWAEVELDDHEYWLEHVDEYSAAVRKAEAQFEINQLTQLNRAASGGEWRAAEKLLRMKHPTKYGALPVGGEPDPQERRSNCENCGSILSADSGAGNLCRLCTAGPGLKVVNGGAD